MMGENNRNGDSLTLMTLIDAADDSTRQAKTLWLFGEWQKLIDFVSQLNPGSSNIAIVNLLAGSAYFQLGQFDMASKSIESAIKSGIHQGLLANILLAGTYNSLAKCAAISKQTDRMNHFFSKAVDVGIGEGDLLAHSRAVKELTYLGLLPQAMGLVSEQLTIATEQPSKIKKMDAQLGVLKTELELLTHELSISQQRLQLYNNSKSTSTHSLTIGSKEYLTHLKKLSVSQLGQDLWVLEKTNYKHNGFFVEFGATDGVLLSNTYLLENQFNWDGICAEPNPKFFKKLVTNRACKTSNTCIGAETGIEVEFICAEEYGGIANYAADDNHASKRQAYKDTGNVIKLITKSLNDFLIENNSPRKIDYLSIDTEGSEFDILESFPFSEWDISLITVEHNFTSNREKICNLLKYHGYKRISVRFDDWYYKNNI